MNRWRRIIRLVAQLAVVGLIIKALRGPVQWRREPTDRR
jgi:hypothetical protein